MSEPQNRPGGGRLRRQNSLMVARQVNKRTKDGAQMYQHPSHAYRIQAAPRPNIPKEDQERWHCEVCQYEWTPHDEQRKRYISVNPREAYNICGECMVAPWSAWVSQKNKLLGGDCIMFFDLKMFGEIDITDTWPSSFDRNGTLEQLDFCRQKGQLPWKPIIHRWLRLTVAAVELVTDLSVGLQADEVPEPGRDYKIHHTLKLDEILEIVYIEDVPHHLIIIFVQRTQKKTALILTVSTSEIAAAVCEAFENTLKYVHTQAIVHSLDDHILAGLDGRTSKMEEQAERKRHSSTMETPNNNNTNNNNNNNNNNIDDSPISRGSSTDVRGSIFGVFANVEDGGDQPDVQQHQQQQEQQQQPQHNTPYIQPDYLHEFNQHHQQQQHHHHHQQHHHVSTRKSTKISSPPSTKEKKPLERRESNADVIIAKYMEQLHASTTKEEMQQFTLLFRAYRTGGDYADLVQSLLKLFGPSRAFLLPGLRSFVKKEDRAEFDYMMKM